VFKTVALQPHLQERKLKEKLLVTTRNSFYCWRQN